MAGVISTVDLSGVVTDVAGVKAVVDTNAIAIAAVKAVVDANLASIAGNALAIAAVKAVVDALVIALAAVQVDINAIRVITDALAILTETGGTLTTDGNEQTVYINDAPSGVFIPTCVKIDMTAQTVTETVVIKEYYRHKSGGAYILADESLPYVGAINPPEIKVDLDPNRYGIKVTLQRTAGDARAHDFGVFYKV